MTNDQRKQLKEFDEMKWALGSQSRQDIYRAREVFKARLLLGGSVGCVITAIYTGVTGGAWGQWAGTMVIQLVILALLLRMAKPSALSVILTWNKEEGYAVWKPFAQFGDRSLDALPADRPELSPEQRQLLLSDVHVPRLFAWSRYPDALCSALERIDPVLAAYTPTEQRMTAFVALQRDIQAAGTDVRKLAQHIKRWVKAERQSIKTAAAVTKDAG